MAYLINFSMSSGLVGRTSTHHGEKMRAPHSGISRLLTRP